LLLKSILFRDYIYIISDSINAFKKRLDKYWSYQDFMFDYTAEIAVIGDQSVLTVEIVLS